MKCGIPMILSSCWEDIYIIWTQFRRFQDFLQVPNFINDPSPLLASLSSFLQKLTEPEPDYSVMDFLLLFSLFYRLNLP